MQTSNHPLIPPNHPRFRAVNGIDQYMGDSGNWCDIDMLDEMRDWPACDVVRRKIEDCANAARCAWLDEARRCWDEADSGIRDVVMLSDNGGGIAYDNADAWAEWLRGEKEEGK